MAKPVQWTTFTLPKQDVDGWFYIEENQKTGAKTRHEFASEAEADADQMSRLMAALTKS